MSKLADKGLCSPCLIVFDEAGMIPKCDTLLMMNQVPGRRWFALVGDWRQEGIITLSDELRAYTDSIFALYTPPPPEQKEGKNKGIKNRHIWYRELHTLKNKKNYFIYIVLD